MKKILVTGAFGLVGSDLVPELQKRFGRENVFAMGNKTIPPDFDGNLVKGDVTDIASLETIIKDNQITDVYHLAGILSVGSEKDPDLAWKVNFGGLKNVLDLAKTYKFKVFFPSSIAAFGATTPKVNTPQHTSLEPTTIYGVGKVSGELMCQYYWKRYGVDARSLRYPGLTGYKAPPGDGTTEYSVHIFYGLLNEGKYACFLKEGTRLPMMYIDDAIKGTIDLMEAPPEKISVRTSYNFGAINFTPEELAAEIKKLYPDFEFTYNVDPIKQAIAESWPQSVDDSVARADWGWSPDFDLPKMTSTMVDGLKKKLGK